MTIISYHIRGFRALTHRLIAAEKVTATAWPPPHLPGGTHLHQKLGARRILRKTHFKARHHHQSIQENDTGHPLSSSLLLALHLCTTEKHHETSNGSCTGLAERLGDTGVAVLDKGARNIWKIAHAWMECCERHSWRVHRYE